MSSVVEFIIVDSDSEDRSSERGQSPSIHEASRGASPEPDPPSKSRSKRKSSIEPVEPAKRSKPQDGCGKGPRHSGRLADPGYKSFACSVCQESFNFKFELLRHKMAHYEKPKRKQLPSAAARWRIKLRKHLPVKSKKSPELKPPTSKLDDPVYLKPLDQGWTRLVVYRPNSVNQVCDIYYVNPHGKRFRSFNELAKFTNGLSLNHFSFSRRPLDLEHAKQIVRHPDSGHRVGQSSAASPAKRVVQKASAVTKITSPPKVPSKTHNKLPERLKRTASKTSKFEPKKPLRKTSVPNGNVISPSPTKSKLNGENDGSDRKFHLPLDHGWTRLVVHRRHNKGTDVYYLDSDGRKFRSYSEIRNVKFKNGITAENFTFQRGPLSLKHPREVIRSASSGGKPAESVAVRPSKKPVLKRDIVPPPKRLPNPGNVSARRDALSSQKRSPIATRKKRTPNSRLAGFIQIPPKALNQRPRTEPRMLKKAAGSTEARDRRQTPRTVTPIKAGRLTVASNQRLRLKPETPRKSADAARKSDTAAAKMNFQKKQSICDKVRPSNERLSDQLYLPPLNQGWSRLVVYRRKTDRKDRNCDIYYVDPEGKKFRSLSELQRAKLGGKWGKGLSSENFCFFKRPLDIVHRNQIVENAGAKSTGNVKLKDRRSSPVRPHRPLTSLIPERKSPIKRVRSNSDPKLDFLSQLDLDSKDLQPRVVLEDILQKKSPDQISSLTASEEPVNGCCDTQSADGDAVTSPLRTDSAPNGKNMQAGNDEPSDSGLNEDAGSHEAANSDSEPTGDDEVDPEGQNDPELVSRPDSPTTTPKEGSTKTQTETPPPHQDSPTEADIESQNDPESVSRLDSPTATPKEGSSETHIVEAPSPQQDSLAEFRSEALVVSDASTLRASAVSAEDQVEAESSSQHDSPTELNAEGQADPASSQHDPRTEVTAEPQVEAETSSHHDSQIELNTSIPESRYTSELPFQPDVVAENENEVWHSEPNVQPPPTLCDAETDNESISNEDLCDEMWVAQPDPQALLPNMGS